MAAGWPAQLHRQVHLHHLASVEKRRTVADVRPARTGDHCANDNHFYPSSASVERSPLTLPEREPEVKSQRSSTPGCRFCATLAFEFNKFADIMTSLLV